jgi:hypothetical protein
MSHQNPLAGPHAPEPEHQFYSLGFLSQMLQRVPSDVMALADAAGVSPAMAIDAVPYFRGCDVVSMKNYLATVRAEAKRQAATN